MNNQLGLTVVSRVCTVAFVAFGGLAFGLADTAHANLITNGSFETGTDPGSQFLTVDAPDSTKITGWTVGGASVDYIGGYWQPGQGVRSIDLSGSHDFDGTEWGSLSQTFATTPGATYVVSFLLSGNPDDGPNPKTVDVTVGSTFQQFTFDLLAHPTSLGDMGWVLKSFDFVADGPSQTITFASDAIANNTFFGPALDNVDVSPIPTPATLPLFLTGLALLALWAWPRRKRGLLR